VAFFVCGVIIGGFRGVFVCGQALRFPYRKVDILPGLNKPAPGKVGGGTKSISCLKIIH